ncbi:MAG: carboxypeptidase regulatory-like domain-containing protein [candidate division Zixibacteria bacterium]|nr:carboxypeptidase regulatory-like domain-containing protein [candidate division Zixibacteria bacterium]
MRFKKFAVLSILTFATLLLFTAVAGAVGSISGRVMLEHEVALLPVEGATVGAILADTYLRGVASPADSHFVASTHTDSNGNYRLENLAAGNYRIVACKEGLACLFYDGTGGGSPYPNFARSVAVVDDQVTSGINITFRPFVPEPPHSGLITGLITDAETGAHLASARVFAHVLRDNVYPIIYETVSDTDGGYRLRVPPESYHVFAEKPGYERGEYPGNPVPVDSGDTVRGIDIALRPSIPPPVGFISGRITDAATGNAIAEAYVSAHQADSLSPFFATRSGPEGYYLLKVPTGDFQPSEYSVAAFAEGYEITSYPGNPVLVGANDTVRGIDIALRTNPPPNPGFITGRITDAQTGLGIPDAWVGASGEWLTIIFQTRTGPDGRYFLPVTAGGYFVRAAAHGYAPGEYPGNPVRVDAYDTVSNVDIALRPISIGFGSISGQVTNAADGLPIPHALVVARQQDGFGFGSTLTDEAGNYRIGPLPAGFYKVAAVARGFYAAVYPEPVEVRADENTPNINLRLRPVPPPDLGMISGMVTDDSTGEPIGCAVVAAVGFDSTLDHRVVRFAYTDSTGSYLLEQLPKIPYFVLAWARGYKGEIYDNVHRFEEATQITPDASGINFALEKKDSTAHTLAGSVSSNSGMPEAGALVTVSGGGTVEGAALSLPDGGFIVEGLASGSYTVSAVTAGASASQSVDLSGGSLAGFNLTLPAGTSLRGDINGDGVYSGSDVVMLVGFIFSGQPVPDAMAADLNCDGVWSGSDIVTLVQLTFSGQSSFVCGF